MTAVLPLSAFNDNYIWIILNKIQSTFACVDPGDATPVLNYAKKNHLRLTHIFITHHHFDHTGGIAQLVEFFPTAKIIAPDDDRVPFKTMTVGAQDRIKLNDLNFQILLIPGHTRTHIAFYEPKVHWLFCGDTLFSAGCGRVFDGSIKELYQSLQTLKQLPDITKIFCAHEYTRKNLSFATTIEPLNRDIKHLLEQIEQNPTQCTLPSTIGLEKNINPFLRTDRASIQEYAKQFEINPDDDLAIFTYLRKLKDTF